MLDYSPPLESKVALPRWIAPLIVLAVALVMQFTVRPLAGDYVERIVLDSGIAVILAVSLNIVNGYTGQFSIGHAAFFAIGGYTAAAITYYASLLIWNDPQAASANGSTYVNIHFLGLPLIATTSSAIAQTAMYLVATVVGGITAAAAGWVVGLPSLRLRGDYLAIVTLGFGEIVRVMLQQTNAQIYTRADMHSASLHDALSKWLPPPVGGALGFINIPKVTLLFWVILLAGLTLIVAWRLKRSTFGRSMIAIRENEIAAESMGVNVTRLKVWAFVVGAFFAGIAGSLYAHEPGQLLTPSDAGFAKSFDVVIMVVLGGLGSISGAAIAAVLITMANEWLRDPTQPIPLLGLSIHVWMIVLCLMMLRLIAWPHKRLRSMAFWLALAAAMFAAEWMSNRYQVDFGDYRMIVYALILILTMIFRPGGLFGTTEITDVVAMRSKLQRQRRSATP